MCPALWGPGGAFPPNRRVIHSHGDSDDVGSVMEGVVAARGAPNYQIVGFRVYKV